LLAACGSKSASLDPTFHAEGNPPLLSDWGVVGAQGDELVLGSDVLAYDLNTPLFSDYAHKLRTVWMPKGMSATYQASEAFDFPVGTIISKTFYYPRGENEGEVLRNDTVETTPLDLDKVQLIETRILAHREAGWIALPYVWNDDQSEAKLKRIGDIKKLTLVSKDRAQPFHYVVPNANQCAGCHATNATTKELLPIGPKARHLNKGGQLETWQRVGYLTGGPEAGTTPKAVNWNDLSASLDARARSYLDINCAHCHNKVGPADTSGLHFEPTTQTGAHLGLCKSPIAAGNGTGGRPFDIVPGQPENSITIYRMASVKPSEMMPELGRSIAHDEGVALIREWIAEMDGDCG
jgi:uncharacterized repeat protein (TIGR03806 family)